MGCCSDNEDDEARLARRAVGRVEVLESLEGIGGPAGGDLVPVSRELPQENGDTDEFVEQVGGGILVGHR
ncbi:hypothetical protein JMJ58_04025 [Haloterrigena salifodinae]|uniref:Uncharacterized protein n=1 Tax=Haloterrigena salifodinae TaxID=2675099 RepID=A0A8T8E3K1_9EURY|nr:hypothetical protein [Haloterrigena salifodinae]QRV16072.1 hypothetical protein JMJ58_04025 [Haloterrigena salifodinae]